MKPINRFLREEDYRLVSYRCLRKVFEDIYEKELGKTPSVYGSKYENQTKIHWSRDWEYPWAVIHSGVKADHRVLDCGCGGSPLLPLLARYGCQAYGVDPGINTPIQSLYSHYSQLWNRVIARISSSQKGNGSKAVKRGESSRGQATGLLRRAVRLLRRSSDNWVYNARRMKRLDVKYFPDSLDKMRFEDEFFDRVFCISVIEHLPEEIAYAGMREMSRVLKKGGLLVVTVDNNGRHVNPALRGKHEELIAATGLSLFGESDFVVPDLDQVPGTYNVVGFLLRK